MNKASKPHLRLFLLIGFYELLLLSGFSVSRAGNRQRSFAEPRGQSSSDKDCLNVLKGEGPRERGGPSTRNTNIRAEQETAAGAGKQLDDKTTEDPGRERGVGIGAGTGVGTGAGIRADTGAGTRAGTRTSTERGNEKREDSRQGDKRNPTRVQSFASHSFFLAAHLFFFFTTSSSEFVTTWLGLLITAGLLVNSKSVISVKHGDLSSRYPVMERWKPRAWKVSSAISSVLQLLNSKASVSQS